jgi:hypothetical protein
MMARQLWLYPLWALFVFWAWAAHVATGFLNNLIAANSGKRSAIIGMLDSFTDAVLIAPFGRPFAVGALVVGGGLVAMLIYRTQRKQAQ